MTNLSKKIEYFCDYFVRQQEIITTLSIGNQSITAEDPAHHQIRFYRKSLLITHIDTLAGIRFSESLYPQLNKRNKDRFIRFLTTKNIWPDGNLVSVPFVAEFIKSGKITNGRLRQFVQAKLAGHSGDDFLNLPAEKIDEPISTMLELSISEQEERIVSNNRHYELLYRYRNYLVHEAREPGGSMEIVPEPGAYYHSYLGDDKLYLAYPMSLFEGVLERSIDYVKSYLIANSIDPYDHVRETARW